MSKKRVLGVVLALIAVVTLFGVATKDVAAQSYTYEYSYDSSSDVDGAGAALSMGMLAVFGCIGLIVYIFVSYCLMVIADKLKVANSWLAFVPIGNLYIMVKSAGMEGVYTLIFLLAFIPFLGGLVVLAFQIYLWMKIAERRGFESWLGILAIVPIANLIMPAYFAFSEPGGAKTAPSESKPVESKEAEKSE